MKLLVTISFAMIGLALAGMTFAQRTEPAPATNPVELSQRYADLLDAVSRSDEATVADAVLLPVKLSRDDSLLYAKRIILGSELQWLAREKLGDSGVVAIQKGRLDWIPRDDPKSLSWESTNPNQMTLAAGGLEVAMGKKPGSRERPIFMVRTSKGWKFDRSGLPPVLVHLDVEDAPWRNTIVRGLIDDIKSGKLIDSRDLLHALLPQAPAEAPAITPGDRASPESAVATMLDALDSSDTALVADSFRYMHENKRGSEQRKQDALRYVTQRQLAKALVAKFGQEQGQRLIRDCNLGAQSLEIYRKQRWAVDGDLAREANPYFYNVVGRMRRTNGIWRIELPPLDALEHQIPNPNADADFARWIEQRPVREMNVLAHLDHYQTPGSVVDALSVTHAIDIEPDNQTAAKELDLNIAEVRRTIATRPATNPQDAFEMEMGLSLMEASAAALRGDGKGASQHFFADADDGSYTLAHIQRTLVINELIEAASREIGGDAARPLYELRDESDDMYGMAMLNWKVDGDRAMGWHDEKPEKGAAPDAKLRKVNGIWKIDITDTTNGDPKAAAARAQDETSKLKLLTEQVKLSKFKTADQLNKAMSNAGFKEVND